MLQKFILEAAHERKLASCHDLSEGGLAVAVAECCLKNTKGLGAMIDGIQKAVTPNAGIREDALYFGESQSRVVISVKPKEKDSVMKLAKKYAVPIFQIGKVGGKALVVGSKIRMPVGDLKAIFDATIPETMGPK